MSDYDLKINDFEPTLNALISDLYIVDIVVKTLGQGSCFNHIDYGNWGK